MEEIRLVKLHYFLARHASKVNVMVRRDNLTSSMSGYLIQSIEATDNIDICYQTEIVGLNGNGYLESIVVNDPDGQDKTLDIGHVFTFIGASPCTDWISDVVVTDKNGFICTGLDLKESDLNSCHIYEQRLPQSLESSVAGFFAVGDVRKNSVKCVASAVGEGSKAVSQVHQHLATLEQLTPVSA